MRSILKYGSMAVISGIAAAVLHIPIIAAIIGAPVGAFILDVQQRRRAARQKGDRAT
jgi:hypothetical protein